MYGVARSHMMVRLLAEAAAGATSIMVDTGMDWVAGEQIYLAPTSFTFTASDYATIQAYDTATGELTLTAPLTYYHFGAAASTAAKYNDKIDLRGEVVLLTRNIKIVGDATQPDIDWGGQIVMSDTISSSGKEFHALLEMKDVEMINCGQKQTFKAAIRI